MLLAKHCYRCHGQLEFIEEEIICSQCGMGKPARTRRIRPLDSEEDLEDDWELSGRWDNIIKLMEG